MASAWLMIVFKILESVMSPDAHDLPDVLNTINIGDPMVRNISLYVTEAYDPGTTVPREPPCRLEDLDFCCQGVWGPHWWEVQRLMISRRDHWITRYRAHYKHETYQDPVVLQKSEFRAPMHADFAVSLQEQKFPLIRPQLQFRCVIDLPYESLLRYVAATMQLYFDARWTRVYRIFCLRKTEEAIPRSELTMQDPLTGEVRLHERWSGRCVPIPEKDQFRRQGQKLRQPRVKKEPLVGDRSTSLLNRPRHGQYTPSLLRKELKAGTTGCIEFPREFLSSGSVLEAHAIPNNNVGQPSTFFDDIRNWDLNHNVYAWTSIANDASTAADIALPVSDSIEMYAEIPDPAGNYMRHTLSTIASGPTSFLASPEVRRTVVDIDLESMIANNAGSTVAACAHGNAGLPEMSLDLQLQTWRASEHMPWDNAESLEKTGP